MVFKNEHISHIPFLLNAFLPGLDPNDILKTKATLLVYYSNF